MEYIKIIDLSLTPYTNKFYRLIKVNCNTFGYKLYKVALTFSLVSIAWIFFRANTLSDAMYIVKNLFIFNPDVIFGEALYKMGLERREIKIAVVSIFVLVGFDLLERKYNIWDLIKKQNIIFRWSLYIIFMLYILFYGIYGSNENAAFIYFQF